MRHRSFLRSSPSAHVTSALLTLLAVISSLTLGQTEPPACAGGETFSFEVQVSLDGGSTWSSTSRTIYAYPGVPIDLLVRTRMTITSGQTQGWSFGLEHDPSWLRYYFGDLTLSAVTTAGTQTATVQNGSPPDIDETDRRTNVNGFTQGVLIDTDQVITLGPTTSFVTAKACYRLNTPIYVGSFQASLRFKHNLGTPPIRSVVTQGGLSFTPCAKNLIL
jgi:hypothetical protein